MNGLLAATAVANPVLTAMLTIVIFIEKDKLRKRSEDLEAALKQCNQEVVETIKEQGRGLQVIATGLSEVNAGLGRHIDKASEVVTELSKTVTESASNLIGDTTTKTVSALLEVKEEVRKIEIAQKEAAKSVLDLQEALKSAISL
ncbi:MAG: hypothetical protein EBZ48_03910 [Proteobacteria bacterium]|nr:hypothetical protein [Pseudomonadota bacterium]